MEGTAPPSAVAPDFTPTQMGRGFAGGLLCQAPSEGDRPFPSSPFAHPIPQSRRRAHMGFIQKFLAASTIVETRGKSAGSPRRIDFAIFFPVGCQ
jgi:hypothetical protein